MIKAAEALAKKVPAGLTGITAAFPDNVTTKNNVIKTADLRVDLHKDPINEGKAVAKVQANTGADDQGVKDYIRSGNKGPHKGTHKTIATIPIDRQNFDAEDFARKIIDAAKNI